MPPFPDNWVDKVPRTSVNPNAWQTQGAREHAIPGDEHSHGNFGRYTVKFYAYSGFGSNKGSQLAQGRFESGESRYYPGWQKNSTGTSSPPYTPAAYPPPDSSHYGGRPETAELRGGLHVHAYLNRTLGYPPPPDNATSYPYAGTAYVYIDVDRFGGGSWSVDAGDWIIAEFVNDEPFSGNDQDDQKFATNNFSADNNASSISAPRPGNTTHQSPLDGKLAVLKYIEGTGQPDTSLSAGRDIVPFFLCGYADAKWYGQPWYYRGRYRDGDAAGSATTGLYDVDSQSGTLLNLASRGPALLVFDKHRLRQVLTPPGDFPGTAFAQICVHAWRWTSLNGHGASTRLGVRILRVSSTSGTNVTSSLLKVWPKSGASGSNIFYDSNNVGPFVAFPTGSFNDFGMIPDPYQPAKILSITPSNLRFTPNDNNPSSEDFEKKVGILRGLCTFQTHYAAAVLNIQPASKLSEDCRRQHR